MMIVMRSVFSRRVITETHEARSSIPTKLHQKLQKGLLTKFKIAPTTHPSSPQSLANLTPQAR